VLWLELAHGNGVAVVCLPFLFSYSYGGSWATSISFNERRCRIRPDRSFPLLLAFRRQGIQVSSVKVGQLLKAAGYSLQANRKTIEGNQHPDRNA